MQKDIRDIDNGKKNKCCLQANPVPVWIYSNNYYNWSLRVLDIVTCIEEIQKKYAKEIVGEVEELQGILKGKDLERYLDQMIAQNNAKGSKNN
jgi:hypothetical protein